MNQAQVYYYKVVAKILGQLLSIYDGKTEYIIGQTLEEDPEPNHKGGYYVYSTIDEAVFVDVPNKKGGLYLAPRTIIKCMCWGNKIIYDKGKIAFQFLCPVQDIGMPKGYLTTKEARKDALIKYQQNKAKKLKQNKIHKQVEWINVYKQKNLASSKIQPYTISTKDDNEYQKQDKKSKTLQEPFIFENNQIDEI